jgi:hypothetical protein
MRERYFSERRHVDECRVEGSAAQGGLEVDNAAQHRDGHAAGLEGSLEQLGDGIIVVENEHAAAGGQLAGRVGLLHRNVTDANGPGEAKVGPFG